MISVGAGGTINDAICVTGRVDHTFLVSNDPVSVEITQESGLVALISVTEVL